MRFAPLVKHREEQVVGIIAVLLHHHNGVDFVPHIVDSVEHGRAYHPRLDHAGIESEVFGNGIFIVAIDIVESKKMIFSRLEIAQNELPAVVGSRNALQRDVGECGVIEIAVHAHEHFLLRLKGARIEHDSRNLHCVDHLAGGECKREAVDGIPFVVVLDGIAEIDGVGGVGDERVANLHLHFAPRGANHRHLALPRRHHHLVVLVLEHHEFVEVDFDFSIVHINGARRRLAPHKHRREHILRATARSAHAGARMKQQSHCHSRQNIERIFKSGHKIQIWV